MTAQPITLACRVRAIIAQVLKCDPAAVVDGARLRADLDATDIDIVDLTMAVEDEIDAEMTDDDAAGLRTVGDLVALAERLAAGEREIAA